MNEIAYDLRQRAQDYREPDSIGPVLVEAADEIERLQAVIDLLHAPRPLVDWHEDIGNVLWWSFPICEPPFSGTPYDSDWPFEDDDQTVGWVPLPDCDNVQKRWEAAEKVRK